MGKSTTTTINASATPIDIDPIDYNELKKNLFPLLKLLKKINDGGGKKKGLNSHEDISNKIKLLTQHSDLLLQDKFKFLYASLCLLQIQNNSYLRELRHHHHHHQQQEQELPSPSKKRKRLEEKEKKGGEVSSDEEDKEGQDKAVEEDSDHASLSSSSSSSASSSSSHARKKNKKRKKEKAQIILENIRRRQVKAQKAKDLPSKGKNSTAVQKKTSSAESDDITSQKTTKESLSPELQNIQHLMDVLEFVKYCQPKPFSDHALFPSLPLKSSKLDQLSLFSRLESTPDDKIGDILHNYTGDHKELYRRCWEDLQKKEEYEVIDHEDDNADDEDQSELFHRDIKKEIGLEDAEEGEEVESFQSQEKSDTIPLNQVKPESPSSPDPSKPKKSRKLNLFDPHYFSDSDLDDEEAEREESSHGEEEEEEDFYMDYLPRPVYRSRLYTDGLMERFHYLRAKKLEAATVPPPRRMKVCNECIHKFHNRLQYIPCNGEFPCQRCKHLGLICYYPVFQKPENLSTKRIGGLYRLKENVNNPPTIQDILERQELIDEQEDEEAREREFRRSFFSSGTVQELPHFTYKKVLNDAHIVGDREDYLQYNHSSKTEYWTKRWKPDKKMVPFLQSLMALHQTQLYQEEEREKRILERRRKAKTPANAKEKKKRGRKQRTDKNPESDSDHDNDHDSVDEYGPEGLFGRPFLGKTISGVPTSELLDSLHYSISKRVSLEKNDNMYNRYDSSALVTLGILYEEIIRHEVDQLNQPGYYQ